MSLNNKENAVVIGYKGDKPILIPFENRYENMLVVGPAGSGKTYHTLIPMIQQDIANSNTGITVLEPNGDLSAKVYEMVSTFNKTAEKPKTLVYFDPRFEDCPYFNPLEGDKDSVTAALHDTYCRIYSDAPPFFEDMAEILISNAVRVVKSLYGDWATLLDLHNVLFNHNDDGLNQYIIPFKELKSDVHGVAYTDDVLSYNHNIANWFIHDYYSDNTKTFEAMVGIRNIIDKLLSNPDLKRVLVLPRKGDENYADFLTFKENCVKNNLPYKLNFKECLANGYVVSIHTARSAYRELGYFLGLLMIQTLENAIYDRVYDNEKMPNMVYVDDAPAYSDFCMAAVLASSKNANVGIHLTTQHLSQLGIGFGPAGKDLVDKIAVNTKNKIVYPKVPYADVKHFEKEFNIKANDMIVNFPSGSFLYRVHDEIGFGKPEKDS